MSSTNNTPERKALLEVAGNASRLPSENKVLAPRAKGQPRRRKTKSKTEPKPKNEPAEPAKPKWVPLTEFKLWEELPIEIREMIWKLLLPLPAIHKLRYDYVRELEYTRTSTHGWCVVAPAPTLLRVCHESRDIGLKALTPMMRRPSLIVEVGQRIDTEDIKNLNLKGLSIVKDIRGINVGQVPEDSPEIDKSTVFAYEDESRWHGPPKKEHGLVFQLEKQNFFNLKNDICYVDGKGWCSSYRDRSLDEFVSMIEMDDSTKISHLALDFQLLTHWDTFERNFDRITKGGKFTNLKTLTLVIVDHGSLRPWSELKDWSHKWAIQRHYQDPITFTDDADIGPYIRPGHRKNGRWFGPWERLAKYFGVKPEDHEEEGPEVVKAAIESTKLDFEEGLKKLRLSNPDTKYPEIKWAYLLRGGMFRLH